MTTQNKIPECVDPNAPVYTCAICSAPVFTCERKESINDSYLCPAHPNGIETKHGLWVCSDKCYDIYWDVLSPENLTESEKTRLAKLEAREDEYLARLDSSLLKCQDRFLNLLFIFISASVVYTTTYFLWKLA